MVVPHRIHCFQPGRAWQSQSGSHQSEKRQPRCPMNAGFDEDEEFSEYFRRCSRHLATEEEIAEWESVRKQWNEPRGTFGGYFYRDSEASETEQAVDDYTKAAIDCYLNNDSLKAIGYFRKLPADELTLDQALCYGCCLASENCLADLHTAIPGFAKFPLLRGVFEHLLHERYEEALRFSLQLAPSQASINLQAAIQMRISRYPEAIETLRQLEESPSVRSLFNLGLCYYRLGMIQQGRATVSQLKDSANEDARALLRAYSCIEH